MSEETRVQIKNIDQAGYCLEFMENLTVGEAHEK